MSACRALAPVPTASTLSSRRSTGIAPAKAAARPSVALPPTASAAGPELPAASTSAFLGRRQLGLAALAAAAAVSAAPEPASAANFLLYKDANDGYQFAYPFGWQEVAVDGQDVVFKDVIEPLESVAVNIIPTDRKSLAEIGPVQEVANTLVKQVLTNPNQQSELVKAVEKVEDGKTYYLFEFTAKGKTYTQHRLGVVTIRDGRFFTLTTGSNERRWSKMSKPLTQMVESFKLMF